MKMTMMLLVATVIAAYLLVVAFCCCGGMDDVMWRGAARRGAARRGVCVLVVGWGGDGVGLPTSRWGVNQEKNRLADFLINPPVNCRHLGGEPVVATDSLSITNYIFYFSIKKLNTKRL